MTILHGFLDYLYENSILNRNGLNTMQEFLRVCDRNAELDEQVVCKLAKYIKQLSASDCYDMSDRLLKNYKKQQEQVNNSTQQYQSTPPAPIAYPYQTQREQKRVNENNSIQDYKNNYKSLQNSHNQIVKSEQSQKKFDWRWKIQTNDKLKQLCNVINRQQYRKGFQAIKQCQNLNSKTKRQLSPQALKMSNHIKQQLNSFFEQEEQKKILIRNNSIQKIVDQKQLSRNQSNEDLKWQKPKKQNMIQNYVRQQNSPEVVKRNRSNISSCNNLSIQQNLNQFNNSTNSPSKISNYQSNSQSSQQLTQIKSLKDILNKEISEANQHLKLNASDIRLNYLNLKESFKLIHEQLEADLITNQEAIQMINSIKEKHYDSFCTFKPNINKENQYYEKIKNRDISNPFERLYKDGIEHKTNKSQILSHIKNCLELKDCTFHPNIQKSTPKPRNVRFAGTLSTFTPLSKENENQNYL